ncbi:hypothetical protein BJ742DRAFT_745912 [Cladochytrium replicatum]|nr:hypothetical protein BJ742DRAFT_745912 [Cladochytrium replicatum]
MTHHAGETQGHPSDEATLKSLRDQISHSEEQVEKSNRHKDSAKEELRQIKLEISNGGSQDNPGVVAQRPDASERAEHQGARDEASAEQREIVRVFENCEFVGIKSQEVHGNSDAQIVTDDISTTKCVLAWVSFRVWVTVAGLLGACGGAMGNLLFLYVPSLRVEHDLHSTPH